MAAPVAPPCDLVEWLSEYVNRLESAFYVVREAKLSETTSYPYISLFPQFGPNVSTAVTNGVVVQASPLFSLIP